MISLIYYTKHALEKMDALGMDKKTIQNVLMKGMKWKEEKGEKWHAQVAGVEVVFTKEDDIITIITTYYIRG